MQTTDLEKGLALPIMEHFYTIQGEGFHTGKAAYFIRIGGCDVGCHWCDVKESWNPEIHPVMNVQEVVDMATFYSKTIVLTGGEPSMWNLYEITHKLHKKQAIVHMETSGAYTIQGTIDWVCLSPKKTSLPLVENYAKAHELKIIIYNKHDFLFAEEQAAKVNDYCKLYLQPEWSKTKTILPEIIDYVMKNPKWKVSLQTHKYMNIP